MRGCVSYGKSDREYSKWVEGMGSGWMQENDPQPELTAKSQPTNHHSIQREISGEWTTPFPSAPFAPLTGKKIRVGGSKPHRPVLI